MRPETKNTCSYSLEGAQIFNASCKEYIEEEMNFILEVWKRHKIGYSARVLDIGCGTGNILLPLLRMGFHVEGIDSNKSMLSVLYQKGEKKGLKPHVNMVDFRNFRTTGKYDAILALYFFIYMLSAEEIETQLHRIYGLLDAGGVLILNLFNTYELWRNVNKKKRKLSKMLQSGNLVQEIKYISEDYLRGIIRVEEFGSLSINSRSLNDFSIRRLRSFTLDEAYLFLRIAGFKNIRAYCGFSLKDEISPDTRRGLHLVFEATRPNKR
jgi:2-polyprenyl-3-methyl-5-hydroxy-6-metoxy-1,4-benzoquinol methylase